MVGKLNLLLQGLGRVGVTTPFSICLLDWQASCVLRFCLVGGVQLLEIVLITLVPAVDGESGHDPVRYLFTLSTGLVRVRALALILDDFVLCRINQVHRLGHAWRKQVLFVLSCAWRPPLLEAAGALRSKQSSKVLQPRRKKAYISMPVVRSVLGELFSC